LIQLLLSCHRGIRFVHTWVSLGSFLKFINLVVSDQRHFRSRISIRLVHSDVGVERGFWLWHLKLRGRRRDHLFLLGVKTGWFWLKLVVLGIWLFFSWFRMEGLPISGSLLSFDIVFLHDLLQILSLFNSSEPLLLWEVVHVNESLSLPFAQIHHFLMLINDDLRLDFNPFRDLPVLNKPIVNPTVILQTRFHFPDLFHLLLFILPGIHLLVHLYK